MTALDERPATTATGPTLRSTARAARGPLLLLLALVVVGTVLGVLGATGPGGRLDPDAYSPHGARAVAELLRGKGVEVRRLDTVDAVEAADAREALLVVPVPEALAPSELKRLSRLRASLVVVGAGDDVLELLDVPARARGDVALEQRRPACDLDIAVTAGDVDLGGPTYRGTGSTRATGCYASGGDATLLDLGSRRATLLGDGALLTNDRLADRGNAALALGLLSRQQGPVLWLVPRPGRPVPEGDAPTLRELLPNGLGLGALQLLIAVGVLALWRARRLGRVVEEPLPVVVRAAEAVEGRSRLYRAAGARGSAAEALRSGTRDRVSRRVGVPVGAERPAVVQLVAERTGSEPAVVDALLYGGPPADDAALVRLASDLRTLETTLTSEVAGP